MHKIILLKKVELIHSPAYGHMKEFWRLKIGTGRVVDVMFEDKTRAESAYNKVDQNVVALVNSAESHLKEFRDVQDEVLKQIGVHQ